MSGNRGVMSLIRGGPFVAPPLQQPVSVGWVLLNARIFAPLARVGTLILAHIYFLSKSTWRPMTGLGGKRTLAANRRTGRKLKLAPAVATALLGSSC